MANKKYEESSIQAIANAIRTKNGSSTTYKVSDMADAILDITTFTDMGISRVITNNTNSETTNKTQDFTIAADVKEAFLIVFTFYVRK